MLSDHNSQLLKDGMGNQPQEGPGVHRESRKLEIMAPAVAFGHSQSQVPQINNELLKFIS